MQIRVSGIMTLMPVLSLNLVLTLCKKKKIIMVGSSDIFKKYDFWANFDLLIPILGQ